MLWESVNVYNRLKKIPMSNRTKYWLIFIISDVLWVPSSQHFGEISSDEVYTLQKIDCPDNAIHLSNCSHNGWGNTESWCRYGSAFAVSCDIGNHKPNTCNMLFKTEHYILQNPDGVTSVPFIPHWCHPFPLPFPSNSSTLFSPPTINIILLIR